MANTGEFNMSYRLAILVTAFMAAISFSPSLRAQATQSKTMASATGDASSKVPDLSGDWALDAKRGGIGQSISGADPGGKMRGKEPDISYQPWALAKTLSEYPSTGPDARYDVTTDPYIKYCEPLGIGRIYMYPARTRFVQTPDAVYVLHEQGEQFRVVRLNSKHPDDPDPQYWGDSIGWYENGDTLVIDSVGFNDRSWLDQVGHPHTEKLHFIERYKVLDKNEIELDMTIDDPGAYNKPFSSRRFFNRPKVPFMQNPWVCSTRENQQHYDQLAKPAENSPAPPSK
jgi:hypothetical protein